MNWGENNHYKIPLLAKVKHNKAKKKKQDTQEWVYHTYGLSLHFPFFACCSF